jgi:hypothetical protein
MMKLSFQSSFLFAQTLNSLISVRRKIKKYNIDVVSVKDITNNLASIIVYYSILLKLFHQNKYDGGLYYQLYYHNLARTQMNKLISEGKKSGKTHNK